jgi:hypothetical protein
LAERSYEGSSKAKRLRRWQGMCCCFPGWEELWGQQQSKKTRKTMTRASSSSWLRRAEWTISSVRRSPGRLHLLHGW